MTRLPKKESRHENIRSENGDIITNAGKNEEISWTILLWQMGQYNWTRWFPEKCNFSKIIQEEIENMNGLITLWAIESIEIFQRRTYCPEKDFEKINIDMDKTFCQIRIKPTTNIFNNEIFGTVP